MVFAEKGSVKRRIPDTNEYRKAYAKLGYKITESGKKAEAKEADEAKKEATPKKADAKA